jgi:hypothetical protein
MAYFINIDLLDGRLIYDYGLDQKLAQYDFSLLKKVSNVRRPESRITLDIQGDMWLHHVYRMRDPRKEIGRTTADIWGFYWKGIFFALETFTFKSNRKYDEKHYSYHAKVRVLTTPEILGDKALELFKRRSDAEKAALLPFPKHLENKKLEILQDLKAALEVYVGGSKYSECTVELEFQGVTL